MAQKVPFCNHRESKSELPPTEATSIFYVNQRRPQTLPTPGNKAPAVDGNPTNNRPESYLILDTLLAWSHLHPCRVSCIVLSMSFPYHCEVRVAYPSASLATIACNTLAVDEELQSNKVIRSLAVEGSTLLARFEATEARILRVVLSGFYDMVLVIGRTFLEFDDGDVHREDPSAFACKS